MSEEEKLKTIAERIKNLTNNNYGYCTTSLDDWNFILNLIEKQQEEIETLKEVDKKICNEELLEKDYVLKNYISKDKIREFIIRELPDDDIMESCSIFDCNGVEIREKLENLINEKY